MQDTISIIWHIDDVKNVSDKLTDDQCREVLGFIEDNHDANIGINWDVIAYAIDHLFPEHTTLPAL